MSQITPITMPKWGLSMTEGKVVEWLAEEGQRLSAGDPVMDIETEKIANTFEALDAGTLRRRVAGVDDVLPIGALLGVLADDSVTEVVAAGPGEQHLYALPACLTADSLGREGRDVGRGFVECPHQSIKVIDGLTIEIGDL